MNYIIPKTQMDNLSKISLRYDTDKGPKHHNYTPIYDLYLSKYIGKKIKFLEMGFGGYEYYDRGGGSAKMWRDYFGSNAKIVVTDIYDKYNIAGVEFHNINNISLLDCADNCDVILDDASHINSEIIQSFELLFPILNSGGLYIVEDLETSYWPDYGYGGNPDPSQNIVKTAMGYFSLLANQLNFASFPSEFHSQFAAQLDYIHFYRNIVIIKKK